MSDKIKLLPCPFCGSTNLVKSPWVECDNCGAIGPSPRDCDNYPGGWNRRAALAQQPAHAVPAVHALLDSDSVPDDFRNQASGYRAGWNDCLAAAPAAPVAQEPVAWVSVSGRLPGEQGQDSEDVLCFLNGHCSLTDHKCRGGGGWGIRIGFYDAEKDMFRVAGQPNAYVTHWMPLPTAPGEDAPPATEQPEKLLDQPAKVGAVRFHAGVSERLVIECAQRHYRYEQAPPFGDDQINSLAQALGYAKQPDTVAVPRELLETLLEEQISALGHTNTTARKTQFLLAGGA